MRVLLADDDPVSRHILRETLVRWGFEVTTAADGLEAWELLQAENAPRLAILDWMMPGMDGVEVCRKVRDNTSGPYIYILLLTSKKERDDIVRGMAAGADDYVSKPFDPQELQMRLKAGKRIVDLQARLLRAQEELQHMATHDNLSGLYNRFAILEVLSRELNRANREELSTSVIVADIDHFKKINDTLGHIAGDAILREVARRLRTNIRAYDAVGRYGGEEFLVVLPNCREAGARETAERLRRAISEFPVELAEGTVRVTLSFGVTTCRPLSSEHLEAVIRTADAALYRAKAMGRNCVVAAAGVSRSTSAGLETV
ncbi:MAG: diguanylate cyclase [Acidobacteria bacterium]|nr:diguanylate cyclase [Acidobacteriota bacterium]